jgi:hypothetical protein
LIKRKVNPDKTVVIGLDTLAEEGLTYGEVRDSARRVYVNYLRELGIFRMMLR